MAFTLGFELSSMAQKPGKNRRKTAMLIDKEERTANCRVRDDEGEDTRKENVNIGIDTEEQKGGDDGNRKRKKRMTAASITAIAGK